MERATVHFNTKHEVGARNIESEHSAGGSYFMLHVQRRHPRKRNQLGNDTFEPAIGNSTNSPRVLEEETKCSDTSGFARPEAVHRRSKPFHRAGSQVLIEAALECDVIDVGTKRTQRRGFVERRNPINCRDVTTRVDPGPAP